LTPAADMSRPVVGRHWLSHRPKFSDYTGLAVVCPITSRIRPFPTSVVLPAGLPVSGEILTSHIRSIDIQARPIHYAGVAVPAETARLVRAKLAAFVVI
jgi:mRNA interferase MazF